MHHLLRFLQVSIFALIALCRGAAESLDEVKLLTKLSPVSNAQRAYSDNTRNQGDLATSASDRSKRISIFYSYIYIYTFINVIVIYDFMHDRNIYSLLIHPRPYYRPWHCGLTFIYE